MYQKTINRRIIAIIMSMLMIVFYIPVSAAENEQSTELIVEELSETPEEEVTETPEEQVTETPEEEVTGTSEEEVKETPKEEVTETPKEEITETSKEEIKETPEEEVIETPKEEVTETPKEEVTETPKEEVTETPKEGVTETPEEEVTETPKEEVTETPEEEVTETPKEGVTETPKEGVTETPEEEITDIYKQDYDNDCKFDILEGNATITFENGMLNFANEGETKIIDTKTNKITDGEIEIKFTVQDDTLGRFGILVRSIDLDHLLLIGNDGVKWGIQDGVKWDFETPGRTFYKGDIVRMRVLYEGKHITLWAAKDDEEYGLPILDKSYDWLEINSGYQGYRKWYTSVETKVDYMYSGEIGSINGEPQGIENDTISVVLDQSVELPSIVNLIYEDGALLKKDVIWDDESIDTSVIGTVQVEGTIEGMDYKPTLEVKVQHGIVSEVEPIKVNLIKDSVDKSYLPTEANVKIKINENENVDSVANITEWADIVVKDDTYTAVGELDKKTEDDSYATVTASGKIIDNSDSLLYHQEYTIPEGITWDTIDGSGNCNINATDGELEITNDELNSYKVVENESPYLGNGELSVTMTASEACTYGILFRASSKENYAGISYHSGNTWAIMGSNELFKTFEGPEIQENKEVNIKCRYIGDKVTVIIDDKVYFDDIVEGITLKNGKVGYSNYGSTKTLSVTELKSGELGEIIKTAIPRIMDLQTYNVQTYPRVIPSLPSNIDIEYYGGINGKAQIVWDYISLNDLVPNGTLKVDATIENEVYEDLAVIEIYDEGPRSYELDFENSKTATDGWNVGNGSGSVEATDDGRLLIKGLSNQGVIYYDDGNIPALKNMTFEADVEFVLPTEDSSFRGGPLVRYVDSNTWANISVDVGKLVWKNGEGYGSFPGSFTPEKGKVYKMVLKAHEGNFSISFDGEEIGKQAVSSLPDAEGYIGFHSWAGQSFIIDNVKVTEIPPLAPPDIPEKTTVISSEKMDVTVDVNFPRVLKYDWKEDGSILKGEDEQLFIVEVNGNRYIPKITSTVAEDKSSIIYTMTDFGDTGIELKGMISVNDNKLRFEIIDIFEPEEKFQTLNIPKQSLATVTASENGKISSVVTTGDWNNIIETFTTVEDETQGTTGKTYAFISNNKFAVSTDSNVTTGGSRVSISTDNRSNDKKTGIGAGSWTYREELGKTNTGEDYFQEDMPWVQIAIAKDENNDGNIDWQDAAILYREDMRIPLGAEDIKNNVSYISMNICYTQNPFLKGLDMVKNIYNYTDGFGQIVLEKGYQAEGHDDSHPDYDHMGIRQGGVKDFNKLIEEGKKYNAKVGIHINATEYHPDAFQFPENIVNLNSPGWGWLDKAYYVDQRKDITTGELFRRLDLLKKVAPELNFVYVDVYTGNDWNASQLGEKVNSLGYMLGTEMNGPLEQYVTWTHWGGDAAYPNKGNNSSIMRFIKYNTQDTFIGDPLLKGNKHLLPGGWGDQQTVLGKMGTGVFYNNNLITKYMQHFEIMKMSSDEVDFTEGVKVVREGSDINYYKDGRLIATTPEDTYNDTYIGETKLFIPWAPNADDGDKSTKIDKIYAWTPFDDDTTEWSLPAEWRDDTSLKLYRLDDLGRHYVKDITVNDGKITLSLEKDVPYLVVEEKSEEPRIDTWGDGQQIIDPGFDSQGFVNEKVTGAAWTGTGENVSIAKEVEGYHQGSPRGGNDIVKITDGAGGISQSIDGLEETKTYSISAWIKNDDERTVTLNVNCGGEDYSSVITRKGKSRSGQAVKFSNDTFIRANVEFTVPEGVSTAEVSVDVADGTGTVYIDDFRCFKLPGRTYEQGYAFYEDFENVDEGISPFLLAPYKDGSNRTHLAEKDLYGRQFMNWVINGRFSLKSNHEEGEKGEIIITEDGSFTLKSKTTYELGLKYALARKDSGYSFNLKRADETIVAEIPLTVTGSTDSIEPIDRGIIKEISTTFTTDEDISGLYMSLDKEVGKEEIILDDIYIKETTTDEASTLGVVNLNTSVNDIRTDMEFIPFDVTALMSNGSNVDMSTAEVIYDISDPTVLVVEDNTIKPLKEGITDLTVKITVDGVTVNSNTETIIVDDSKIIEYYTVDFYKTGEDTEIYHSANIISGSTLTLPSVPVREGYTFEGWYTDTELTKAFDEDSIITSNMNIYGKWNKEIEYYTVDFYKTGEDTEIYHSAN
ncbi:endo-alpha-N-acetylgalactosaminidase family protein, partial [Vallitalea longa]|uniref:endo-alpha-N-acetylgalactosaminidase family protein n=1 Tax=Vallitalea longa TaxID=2936439 RepID=UPI0024931DA2